MQHGLAVTDGITAVAAHRVGGVIRTAEIPCHNRRKRIVDRRQHGIARAEVYVKRNGYAVAVFVRRIFVCEYIRIAPAERVNRLFYVADHKGVIACDERQYSLLNAVYVLIFVGENVFVFVPDRRQHVGIFGQQSVCEVFEVGKIQTYFVCLFLGVSFAEHYRKTADRRRRAGGCQIIFEVGFFVAARRRRDKVVAYRFKPHFERFYSAFEFVYAFVVAFDRGRFVYA